MEIHTADAFDLIYRHYYPALYVYASRLLNDTEAGKEVTQEVFLKMWQSREGLELDSVKAYLFKSVKHKCLDYLKHGKVRDAYARHVIAAGDYTVDGIDYFQAAELHQLIRQTLFEMPPDVKAVFEQSRFEGLTYQQIAEKEDISVKTVEARMTRALKIMRTALREYLK